MSDTGRMPNKRQLRGVEPGDREDPARLAAKTPLVPAFFRVMRALMFEETPHPELSALPLAQLRLLWTVFFSPDATMKFFSERLNVSQSTLTQLAERLVRRGLIERMHDSADRRVVRLRVTATGRRVLEEASASQHHTFAKVWDTLASKERALVLRGLETLGRAAEEVRAAEGRPIIHAPPCPAGGEDQTPDLVAAAQPVVNLMARRIRGKAAG